MKFEEISAKEFQKLNFACENFLQSAEMYARYQQLGREAFLVAVKDAQGVVLAAGLLTARNWRLGKKIFRVPGGWLMDYDAQNYAEVLEFLTREAKKFVRARGGIALEVSPYLESQPRDANNKIIAGKNNLSVKREFERLGYKYLGEYEQAKWEFVLDLAGKTPEGLLAEFRTTHRQLIKKAERDGVRVRELGDAELGTLKQIAAESGRRHGFRDPELAYYQSMKAAFGDKVQFLVAEARLDDDNQDPSAKRGEQLAKRGEQPAPAAKAQASQKGQYVPVAAAMFVQTRREITYLYSGSVRELQKYNGVYAIQWVMIQRALKAGCERYNFYGTHPVATDGVYRFKQGFRGRVLELLGSFILPIGLLGRLYAARLRPQEMRDIV